MTDIKSIYFKNKDQLKLKGIYIKTNNEEGINLIVCHGFTGTKEGGGKAIEMGKYFAKHGINVLLFDFSGNGESEGEFRDITLTRQVHDLHAAVSWINSNRGGKIFLMGRSFGGTTAICYQGTYKGPILGVIGINSVARPYTLFQNFIHKEKGDNIVLRSVHGEVKVRGKFFDDLRNWDVLFCASNISPSHLFIIHGQADELVDPMQGKEIYLAAREPKRLKIVPGLDHSLSKKYKVVWGMCLKHMIELTPGHKHVV